MTKVGPRQLRRGLGGIRPLPPPPRPIIEADGTVIYRDRHGNLHRDDGPALVRPCGDEEWFVQGKRHRTDGPAVIKADGRFEWWQAGKLHRDDGPAVIEPDGTQIWYRHDRIHRDDGPARIYPAPWGSAWYRNGERLDDPEPAPTDG